MVFLRQVFGRNSPELASKKKHRPETIRKPNTHWLLWIICSTARKGDAAAHIRFLLLALHFIGRRILRPVLPAIIDLGCANIGMTQPCLDFGNVGLVLQRIGGCGCFESMDAQTFYLNPAFFA